MATLTITMDLDNDAFRLDDGLDHEAVADSVRQVAKRIARGAVSAPVRDANGNTVGEWSIV